MRTGALLLLLFLGGCIIVIDTETAAPPIPPPSSLQCCWQSEELVRVGYAEGELLLHSIAALQADQLTLVILDSLGHRRLTLSYDGSSIQALSAPPGWDVRFNHYLLLAIFLHHSTTALWVTGSSGWTVSQQGQQKSLLYRGKTRVTLDYSHSENNLASKRTVRFADYPLTLEVTTLSRSPL